MIVIVKGKADYLWWIWYWHEELYIAHFVIVFELGLLVLDFVKPSSKDEVLDIWRDRYACLLLYFRPCNNALSIVGNDAECFFYLAISDSCHLHCRFTYVSLLRFDHRRSCKIQI